MSVQPKLDALIVNQWLEGWDDFEYKPEVHQRKPPQQFLLMSIPAKTLRSLSEAHRRRPVSGVARQEDLTTQREHEQARSDEIARFVREGYPISSFPSAKAKNASPSLKKPGWLPTAVVVNILQAGESRGDRVLDAADAISVPDLADWPTSGVLPIGLPDSFVDSRTWVPSGAAPLEVIDGQHRLWAFDEDSDSDNYELPVVAFFDLDFSWQAYLFWTINIKPKKINASLAYDLYPLLRDQDWLEQGEGLSVYRETRAQELTESLWSYPSSPWRDRINMLGASRVRATQPVTQAAFVRALTDSFVRPWDSRSGVGGLFGGSKSLSEGMGWTRSQQAAILIRSWIKLSDALKESTYPWAVELREAQEFTIQDTDAVVDSNLDASFTGVGTLLASDQGVRGYSHLINDLLFLAVTSLEGQKLKDWKAPRDLDQISQSTVQAELDSLEETPIAGLIDDLAAVAASFDWRNTKAPGIQSDPVLLRSKQALRGSGGYNILRTDLYKHVQNNGSEELADLATTALARRVK